jgi:hypothetical protein
MNPARVGRITEKNVEFWTVKGSTFGGTRPITIYRSQMLAGASTLRPQATLESMMPAISNALPAGDSSLPAIFDLDEIDRVVPCNEVVHQSQAPKPFDPDPRHSLERDFPRVMKAIAGLWGSAMCAEYLRSLIMMNVGEKRQGFPMEVIEDLLLLDRCNSELLYGSD